MQVQTPILHGNCTDEAGITLAIAMAELEYGATAKAPLGWSWSPISLGHTQLT